MPAQGNAPRNARALQSSALPDPDIDRRQRAAFLRSARSAASSTATGSKYGVDGVEGQPCCRFAHIDVDHDAGKCEALHIGPQLDRIADRNDRLRQLARRGVERKIGSARAASETTSTTASIALRCRAKDAVSIGFTQSSYVNQHNKMQEQQRHRLLGNTPGDAALCSIRQRNIANELSTDVHRF